MMEKSSGNVFADLGMQNADEALAKAKLARQIGVLTKKRGLKQLDAAHLFDIEQSRLTALTRGVLSGFSIGQLLGFIKLLCRDD
jgi:predicted XRE-type DNA-binding protein